jgi:ribosomal protein S18 acetylase RimI-like enzyme
MSTTTKTNRFEEDKNILCAEQFFIRPALMNDMDKGSKILADGFFYNTNFFRYHLEKFITYSSLEANFPNSIQERSRYEIYVACCIQTGEVIGWVEIDARERGVGVGQRSSSSSSSNNLFQQSGGSPYMCNLAVDVHHQRKGIATSLVYECERQVQEWYNKYNINKNDNSISNNIINNDDGNNNNNNNNNNNKNKNKNKNNYNDTTSISNSVCLKVRESNMAAIQMYLKLGYLTVWQEKEGNGKDDNILVMRKQLSSSSFYSSSSISSSISSADVTATTNNNNTARRVVVS